MANIYSTPSDYWIKPGALTISLNAVDNPQYTQASVLSGAVIMAFKPGVIEYDYSHNYRKWNLIAENTFFKNSDAKYVYARLDRKEDATQALIVYSSEKLDILGRKASEEDGEEDPLYFYIYLGSITSSVNNDGSSIPRVWDESFNFGTLATDQSIREETSSDLGKMFRLNEVTGMIEVLKTISEATINTIRIGKKLFFGKKEITDVKRSIDDDKDVPVGDDNLATSKYVEAKALLKDQPDQTNFLLKIGEAIDSMIAGKGTLLFPDGRIQTSRLEVRESMTIMEIIFNRLSAMESDYGFSESGCIESVELLEDGTYNIKLKKRHDTDFTALDENDVIYGQVNDLASGGGNYFTSWLRILHVNTSANLIKAVLYPDSEVPGGTNFPPVELMILMHRGNPVNEERQGYWYLSSREKCICMLDGVTKPILEEHNYAVIIGRLKNLTIFDNLPINYRHSYIYCRGIAIQDLLRINYQGQVVRQEVPRGPWSEATATGDDPYRVTDEQVHTVYHVGCKWRCAIDNTADEPKWNAPGWVMIEGNSNLSMRFGSSAGNTFFAGRVSTTVTPYVYLGENDISDDILAADWAWMRDTGNVTEDNAWTVAHATNGRVLQLGNEDMGSNWSVTRKTAFICKAYVRDGADLKGIENRIIA